MGNLVEAWIGCRKGHEARCRSGHCDARETVSSRVKARRIRQAYGDLPEHEVLMYVLADECGPNCTNRKEEHGQID